MRYCLSLSWTDIQRASQAYHTRHTYVANTWQKAVLLGNAIDTHKNLFNQYRNHILQNTVHFLLIHLTDKLDNIYVVPIMVIWLLDH